MIIISIYLFLNSVHNLKYKKCIRNCINFSDTKSKFKNQEAQVEKCEFLILFFSTLFFILIKH